MIRRLLKSKRRFQSSKRALARAASDSLQFLAAWDIGLGAWLSTFLCIRQIRRAQVAKLMVGTSVHGYRHARGGRS